MSEIYVIQRCDDGKYVSRRNSHHSYTSKLEMARGFHSQEKAYANGVCENERVIGLSSIVHVDQGD